MLSTMDKFWAALLIAAANVFRSRYGLDFGLDAQMANDIIGGLTAAVIWAVPNKAA